jgi:putative intracellular protease/amidase
MTEPVNVGILVFDDVEVLDFAGPFEVFATAMALGDGAPDDRRLYSPWIIAEEQRIINCRGGLLAAALYVR